MWAINILAISLSVGLAVGQDTNCEDCVTVESEDGTVVGKSFIFPGRRINKFLGIPYAKPPVDELRFKPPEPAERWDRVNAFDMPPACPQPENSYDDTIDEDCLYLNIWTPEGVTDAPVMIWIYGGALLVGSTTLYDGTMFPVLDDVVFVSMNYRVNVFGFLNLNSDEARGNVGLLDQHMAIKWVHDNIHHFGGNPNKMTIFGESAGAFSTMLQTITPLPKYFQNIAVQSPYAVKHSNLEVWSTDATDRRSQVLVAAAGCGGKADAAETAACLRDLRWQDIVERLSSSTDAFINEEVPIVTVDGQFFTELPDSDVLKTTSNLSVIIGTNENEGMSVLSASLAFRDLFSQEEKPYITDDDVRVALEDFLAITDDSTVDYMHRLYGDFGDNLYKLDAMLGDRYYTCPTQRYALGYEAGTWNKVYLYRMQHGTSARIEPAWTGANHGLEIDHVFGAPIAYPQGYSQEEVALSTQMIRYWTNLAKYRTPTSGNVDKVWPRYSKEDKEYLILATSGEEEGGIRVETALREKQCNFWDNVYPGLLDGENLNDLLEEFGLDDETTSSSPGIFAPLTSLMSSLLLIALSALLS